MKAYLLAILLCATLALTSLSQCQPTATSTEDPWGLVKTDIQSHTLQDLCTSNWNQARTQHIYVHKAQFFHVLDHASFIDYLQGSYDAPRDQTAVDEARRATQYIIAQAPAYTRTSVSSWFHAQEIQELWDECQAFELVRYCPQELKQDLYSAYVRLDNFVHAYKTVRKQDAVRTQFKVGILKTGS